MESANGSGLGGQGFIILYELYIRYIFAKPLSFENLAEVAPVVAETSRDYLFQA
ncbi:dTDP-rhamnose-3,5-epimerase [Agrobacterium sp. ATCC 31749]|nr:dTDP-rhamnose-3,5-epimerase [Agrobacterium sp. ATCC 31749]